MALLAYGYSATGQTSEYVVHGIPHMSAERKMKSMVLIAAPFLDSTIDVRDVIRWIGRVSRDVDPYGTGLAIDLQIFDERPINERTTMDQWDGRDPDKSTWPQIRRVTIYEYLTYLAKVSGLAFTTTVDQVIISKDISSIEPGS